LETARDNHLLPTLTYKGRDYGVAFYHKVLWKHFVSWVDAQTKESKCVIPLLQDCYQRIETLCLQTQPLTSTKPIADSQRQLHIDSDAARQVAREALKACKTRLQAASPSSDPMYYHPAAMFQRTKTDTSPRNDRAEKQPSARSMELELSGENEAPEADDWVPRAFFQS